MPAIQPPVMVEKSSPAPDLPTSNLKAILLMVLAMCGFAVADTFIKLASIGPDGIGASAGHMLVFQGAFGFVAFGILLWRSGQKLTLQLASDPKVLLRTSGDIIAACSFVSALTLMPVGDASAILQFQPLVVTLGAVLFLKEQVSWFRWSAIGFGFVGVMIIIRPGTAGFDPASILVLVAVIGLTIRDLSTRILNQTYSTFAIACLVSAAMVPAGLMLHHFMGVASNFDAQTVIYMLIVSSIGMAAYYSLTLAMRIGEVSVVAPYRYSRLVAAFVFAFVILGERPDQLTLAGSVLVVFAGLIVLWRERKLGRHQLKPPSRVPS